MRHALVWTAIIGMLAAGCVTPLASDVDAADAAAALAGDPLGGLPDPLLVGHDHADVAAHALTAGGVESIAHLTLKEPGQGGLAFGEMDLLGDDHLAVAGVLGGLYVIDISDRAAPAVASYLPDAGFIADVKASESGNFLFVGVQLAGFTGVHVYNVVVREAPVLVGGFPMEGGCHMLAVHEGHLYCAPNDPTIRIFSITETPATAVLTPVGAYAPMSPPPTPAQLAPSAGAEMTHDMTVQDDPLTGESVMLVSFWDYGVRIVDVEDPTAPVEVGAWAGEGAGDEYEGNLHTSMLTVVEGRRVLVTLPEYAVAPAVTFLDATDLENVSVIGVWMPKPADAYEEQSRMFSTHNFQVVNGHAYVAMYHGGVWEIDATTLDALRAPHATAYHLPSATATSAVPNPATAILGAGSVNVWDVVLKDGILYASDMGTGLHALKFPGAGEATSFA